MRQFRAFVFVTGFDISGVVVVVLSMLLLLERAIDEFELLAIEPRTREGY